MDADRQIWRDWARILQRWGMADWIASLLEAAGPLTIFGAQVAFLSRPLLDGTSMDSHLDVFARMMEDKDLTEDFVHLLREAPIL